MTAAEKQEVNGVMAQFGEGIWVSQSRRKFLQELIGCEAETIYKLYPLGVNEKGNPAPATGCVPLFVFCAPRCADPCHSPCIHA